MPKHVWSIFFFCSQHLISHSRTAVGVDEMAVIGLIDGRRWTLGRKHMLNLQRFNRDIPVNWYGTWSTLVRSFAELNWRDNSNINATRRPEWKWSACDIKLDANLKYGGGLFPEWLCMHFGVRITYAHDERALLRPSKAQASNSIWWNLYFFSSVAFTWRCRRMRFYSFPRRWDLRKFMRSFTVSRSKNCIRNANGTEKEMENFQPTILIDLFGEWKWILMEAMGMTWLPSGNSIWSVTRAYFMQWNIQGGQGLFCQHGHTNTEQTMGKRRLNLRNKHIGLLGETDVEGAHAA